MNTLEDLFTSRPPTSKRPLLGLTVLVVEDSRYACEALRLMCLKSGARIRRAGNLFQARRHLQTYRPGVVIVDLGLPDGCGTDLIHELQTATPRVDVILGSSGDIDAENRAITAGADGFLPKPISNLAAFQSIVLSHLPEDRIPTGPRSLPSDEISPDPMALRDDLSHVADLLNGEVDEGQIDYVTQFMHGIALSMDDPALVDANTSLARRRLAGEPLRPGIARLASAIQEHLNKPQSPL